MQDIDFRENLFFSFIINRDKREAIFCAKNAWNRQKNTKNVWDRPADRTRDDPDPDHLAILGTPEDKGMPHDRF